MNTPKTLNLEVGQQWRTRDGGIATIVAHITSDSAPEGWNSRWPWQVSFAHPDEPESTLLGYVTAQGRWLDNYSSSAFDFVELLTDLPSGPHADAFERIVHEAPQIAERMPAGVGDVTSTAKGSGARYNGSKPPLDLVPLYVLAESLEHTYGIADADSPRQAALSALYELAAYQARGDRSHLMQAMDILGLEGWNEAARVFDYGRNKYAAWNWAKGMAWSIPIACAARHLRSIIEGEHLDPESRLPHRGHVFCNFAMVLCYEHTFTEGDDRAMSGYLPLLYTYEEAEATE